MRWRRWKCHLATYQMTTSLRLLPLRAYEPVHGTMHCECNCYPHLVFTNSGLPTLFPNIFCISNTIDPIQLAAWPASSVTYSTLTLISRIYVTLLSTFTSHDKPVQLPACISVSSPLLPIVVRFLSKYNVNSLSWSSFIFPFRYKITHKDRVRWFHVNPYSPFWVHSTIFLFFVKLVSACRCRICCHRPTHLHRYSPNWFLMISWNLCVIISRLFLI